MTAKTLEEEARDPNRSEYACGDNSCVFGSPGGMATNGGCRCFDDLPHTPDGRAGRRRLTRGILYLRGKVKDLFAAATARDKEIEEARNMAADAIGMTVDQANEIGKLRRRNADLELTQRKFGEFMHGKLDEIDRLRVLLREAYGILHDAIETKEPYWIEEMRGTNEDLTERIILMLQGDL